MSEPENEGFLGEAPNEKWKKFLAQFSEIDSLEISKWRPAHILSYFCKKYYQTYNTKYAFKFNTPSPVKSFEVFQVKRLALNLSSDPLILKAYIDWAFRERVSTAKRRLTSISFLTQEDLVNNYKMNVLLNHKPDLSINRSTPLPAEYSSIIKNKITWADVVNYGDLAFLHKSMRQISCDATFNLLESVFNELSQLGLDIEMLQRIV